MEQAPSLDIVYLAVSALYNNPNSAEKEKASQWLGDLQKSVYSWKIADDLLHQKRDLESCYFAAQTMRTKIQLSFHELPLEAHNSLRASLLEHISQITEGTNTIIVTQLCLALADLALQMPSWHNSVLDLVNSFSQTCLWPLLEIMTVLPEELESRSVRLGANRRTEVLDDFKRCAPAVLELLKVCLSNNGENVQINIKVIRCFTSWVTVNAITLNDANENVVVSKAFHILGDRTVVGALHNAATDCVCTLLQCLEDNNNQQTLEHYLYRSVVALEDTYHISVANEDQEKSMNYSRIFTELAETFLDKILNVSNEQQQHFAINILDLVLVSVGHHDYEVAEVSFNLWYLLSEELYQKNSKTLTELFRPYVERLVTALARHCQMEPDHEGLLDDGDEFKDFRLKVSDLIKDVVFIVGSSTCFRQMFINLQAPGVTWDSNEAALFIMQAVAKNVLPTENEVVPKVVEAILNLPENTHIAVRFTSVLLLGELCEWVEKHPQSLEPILNFLLYCLQQGGIAAAAATALQSICAACSDHMPRHIPVLLQLLENVDSFAITNYAVIGLLKGVAAIIGCMPHQDLTAALRQLVFFQIKPVLHLLEQEIPPVRGTKSDPVFWLDRLSSIFRNVHVRLSENETSPCQIVVTEVWPILSRVFDKYQSDIRIIERTCRSVRFMLRCVSQQARHLLEPLVAQMVRLYVMNKHSSFLYLGSILVDEYATDLGCIQGLLDMLQSFIDPTFCLLKEENGLRNHPDTVDDFFRLCTRFIQRAPIPFLQCSSLPLIIQCALLSSTLEHKEANTSVMKFFYDLISCGQSGKSLPDFEIRKNLVRGLIQEHGQQLVTNLLHACVFYLQTYMLPDVADVIVELILLDREALGHWLETAVRSLPVQANGVIVAATPQQLQDFHISVTRSDTSKSVTHALKEITRLYR